MRPGLPGLLCRHRVGHRGGIENSMSKGGIIQMGNGFRFFWSLQGGRHPEIFGHVENPKGGIVPRSSGWYRTSDPEAAAKSAAFHLVAFKRPR